MRKKPVIAVLLLELAVHAFGIRPYFGTCGVTGKKKRGGVYTHLPKRPETINISPKIIRAIASNATAVITPAMGFISATKPSMTAIIPTIIIPGVPRPMAAKPAKIKAKATSQPRVSVP